MKKLTNGVRALALALLLAGCAGTGIGGNDHLRWTNLKGSASD
jgi:hypothetical protein